MSRLEGGLHGLKAYPSARSDDQDFRHGVMLLVGLAWLIVMCNAGSRTARRADGLHMKGWRECAQVPTMRREGAVAASVASEAAASVALAAAWGIPFNSFDQVRIGHSPNGVYGISTADRPQSTLMLRARITLPHFSVSSAMNLPKSLDLAVNLLDDFGRRGLWCADALPIARFVAWHELSHGRDVRQRLRASGRGDRERAQPASPDIFHRFDSGSEHDLHPPGDEIGDRRAATTIGHVSHVDAGHHLEQLAREMGRGSLPSRRHGGLTQLALGVSDELGDGRGRNIGWPASRNALAVNCFSARLVSESLG